MVLAECQHTFFWKMVLIVTEEVSASRMTAYFLLPCSPLQHTNRLMLQKDKKKKTHNEQMKPGVV